MLLYIRREASELRRELEAVATEIRDEERMRFEGALEEIEAQSTELLFALPDGDVH